MRSKQFLGLIILLSSSSAIAQEATETDAPALPALTTQTPSAETQAALAGLSTEATRAELGAVSGDQFLSMRVETNQDGLGANAPSTSDIGVTEVPFVSPETLIVTLDSNLTAEESNQLIQDYDWQVVETYPNLGQMTVRTDLSRFFAPQLGTLDPNTALIEGVIETNRAYSTDPRIESAIPEFLLSTEQRISTSNRPQVEKRVAFSEGNDEQIDWGISDIQADMLWSIDGAQGGAILGVLDVGFNDHEDLVFLNRPLDMPIDDHGNHVSGIACARHNSLGTVGVVPNCFVVPRTGNVFPVVDEGDNIMEFMVTFSMILSTLNEFLDEEESVSVFNLSLGYNWSSNFGINPDAPENGIYRQLVATHGETLMRALKVADDRNAVIVSAAGNDSRGLSTPMSAKFASPFNWAALTASERGESNAGLVVEAHDRVGSKAVFSNVGGHLSCPGVDILSTISTSPDGSPSKEGYGTMSGTSMASPYCAGGILLFSLVRPSYSSDEIVDCIIANADPGNGNAPKMRLQRALETCS